MNQKMIHFWELLCVMTEKELRARYKYTIFGFFWLVLNPVLQMVIIGFVFRLVMKEPLQNYYLYLFVGLLTWNFFSLSLTKATSSIVFERGLIKKAAFPKYVIPFSIIVSNFIHFIVALTLYLIPAAFANVLLFTNIPSVIIGIIFLVVFTSGLTLLTTALNVRFRDVNFFVQAILTIWFYATPIIYSFQLIPARYIWLWRFNPMTCIVQLLQHGLVNSYSPGWGMIASNGVLIIVISILGAYVFQKESKFFDDWV